MASYSETEVSSAVEAVSAEVENLIPTGFVLAEKVHHLTRFPDRKNAVLLLENHGLWKHFGKDIVTLYLEHYKLSFGKPLVRRYLDFRVALSLEIIPNYFADQFMHNLDIERLLAAGDIKLNRQELSIVFTAFAVEVCDKCQRAVIHHFESLKPQHRVFPQLLQDDAGIMLLGGFALKKVTDDLENFADDNDMLHIAKAIKSCDKDALFEDLTQEERSLLSERDMGDITFLENDFIGIFHSINGAVVREMEYDSYSMAGRTIIEKTIEKVSAVKVECTPAFRLAVAEVCQRKSINLFSNDVCDDMFDRLCDRFVNTRIDESFVVLKELFANASWRRIRGGQSLRDRLFTFE